MGDSADLWPIVAETFPIFNGKLECPHTGVPLRALGGQISLQLGSLDCFQELLWMEICSAVRNQIAPKFWAHFKQDSKDSELVYKQLIMNSSATSNAELPFLLFDKFVDSVKQLDADYNVLVKILERLYLMKADVDVFDENIRNTQEAKLLRQVVREALLGQLPAYFNHVVYAFYFISLHIFIKVYGNTFSDDMVTSESHCTGCNCAKDECRCQHLITTINEVNGILLHMELLDRIAGQTMTSLVQKRIREHITDTCQGIFNKSHLKELEMWLDKAVIGWLTQIFNHGSLEIDQQNTETKQFIESFKVKLTYFLYENFAQGVIEQFFNVIIDFPESIPAVNDLKICMEKIDMRKHLIKRLKNLLTARILHPGVNTMDILTGYVAAIKSIRHLDSSGVILEAVMAPIKEYLRKRTDTVRRVVTGLTEEGPTDLSEELAKGEGVKENMGTGSDDLGQWENWMPDPFGIEPESHTQSANVSRTADIISMVVDIYGTKELFMNEYRNLMANRLLTQLDFNPEREIRNLELLKLRFGETLLHSCEVMLKDVADSKRINTHIQSDAKYIETKQFDISSLIISAQFWPSFNKESLELPEEIADEFKKYTTSYEAYKGNRTLNWRSVTGRVNIEIEFGKRKIDMSVTPTQAIIIYHFQNKTEWTLEDLSSALKVPSTVLRRRITFWQTHNLITETRSGVYKLMDEDIEEPQFDEKRLSQLITDDEELESVMASASDQREEELQVFWSYIVGMLTNLDSLPIERIHQMLKLFATHGQGVEFSQEELKNFLQRKVREHKLIFSGGVYQLAK